MQVGIRGISNQSTIHYRATYLSLTMRVNVIYKGLLVASLLTAFFTAPAQTPAQNLPAFTFFKPDQKTFTEKHLPGGKLLLFIFFDPGCEHCQRTVGYINQHWSDFSKASMIMVSMDKLDKINAFMNTYAKQLLKQKNLILLQDRNYQFITNFKPKKFPALFLYSAKKQLLLYDDREESIPAIVHIIQKTGR